MAKLPKAVQEQGVNVKKVSTNILQVISLYSEDDHFDDAYLSNYAIINLQYPLGRIPGVGEIKIFGAGPYSMRIWLNPERLKFYNLAVNDIVTAIKQNNVEMVAGKLGGPPVPDEQSMQFTINGLGRLTEVVEFENIIVKSSRGNGKKDLPNIVRVKDLARVELSQQGFNSFAKINDHKAAQIIVYTTPGSNALEVGEQIRKAMLKMSQDFPKGLKYGIFYDTTQDIKESINAVYETLAEAGILVLIVIMVFLQDWRATLVPATTVPVTIIGAFGAMAMMGFTVNLMTLFALILAVGIVVDDAVIIVENASHYIEKGLSPKDAAMLVNYLGNLH
jgi:HAE1 family hydrophobic/amphiphilic exporter-1